MKEELQRQSYSLSFWGCGSQQILVNKICPFHPLAGHLGIFPFKLSSLSKDGWAFPWPVVRDPIFEIDLRLRQTRSGGAGGELFAKSVEESAALVFRC